MRTGYLLATSVLMVGATLWAAASAQAETLDACGSHEFDPAFVSCSVSYNPGCDLGCTPSQFFDECAFDLAFGCQTECTFEAEVGCSGSCQVSCEELECTGGEVDCYASCSGGCTAECDATCTGDADEAHCQASCSASCEIECEAGCEVAPLECTGGCAAACEAECHASANLDCQVTCQSDGFLACEGELINKCRTQCADPDGALFCFGDWVNTDDVDACAAEIESTYSVEVAGYVEGEGRGCSAAPYSGTSPSSQGMLGLGLLGLAISAVRRRRSQSTRPKS